MFENYGGCTDCVAELTRGTLACRMSNDIIAFASSPMFESSTFLHMLQLHGPAQEKFRNPQLQQLEWPCQHSSAHCSYASGSESARAAQGIHQSNCGPTAGGGGALCTHGPWIMQGTIVHNYAQCCTMHFEEDTRGLQTRGILGLSFCHLAAGGAPRSSSFSDDGRISSSCKAGNIVQVHFGAQNCP